MPMMAITISISTSVEPQWPPTACCDGEQSPAPPQVFPGHAHIGSERRPASAGLLNMATPPSS